MGEEKTLLVIDLSELFSHKDYRDVLASYRQTMYELYGFELDERVLFRVYSYAVDEANDVVELWVWYVYDSDMYFSPGLLLGFRKHVLDDIFDRIKQDYNLPKDFDLYPTLGGAVVEISSNHALLYLNLLVV